MGSSPYEAGLVEGTRKIPSAKNKSRLLPINCHLDLENEIPHSQTSAAFISRYK